MSDSNDKKKPCRPASQPRVAATKPCRPASSPPPAATGKPCRPASTPTAAVAKPCRPSAPATVSTTARAPNRPVSEPVRTPPSRVERLVDPTRTQAQPRSAAPRPYASTPKPRGGTSLGSFGALAKVVVPSNGERDAARRAECERKYDSATSYRVTGCTHAPYEETVERDAMVPLRPRETTARTALETSELRAKGYRYSRETAKLGDLSGHRTVAFCDQHGNVAHAEIRSDVSVHWFMSPDIPAWKSRAVPTERIGQAATRAVSDCGRENFEAIFEGPSLALVTRLYYRRWAWFYHEHKDSGASVESMASQLWDAIVEDEFRKADLCLEYAFAIGEARFARLWNLALDSCTSPSSTAEPIVDAPVPLTGAVVTA